MTDLETTSLTLQAVAIATITLTGLGQIAVIWHFRRQMVWNRLPIGPEPIHSILPLALPTTAR